MEKRKRLRMQKKMKQNRKLMKAYANNVKIDSKDNKVEKEIEKIDEESTVDNSNKFINNITENGTSTQNDDKNLNENKETTTNLQEFEILGTDKFSDKKKVIVISKNKYYLYSVFIAFLELIIINIYFIYSLYTRTLLNEHLTK